MYLESYPKHGDLCTAIDCDNQGNEEVSKLRVLLVSKEDAEYMAKNDALFSKYNIDDTFFQLPKIALRKVVLNTQNSATYNDLKQAFFQAISKDGVVLSLTQAITTIINHFGNLLNLDISTALLNQTLANFLAVINLKSYQVPFNFQYRYDYLKDIIDTYNELKNHLFSIRKECNPGIHSFPKHLMLGLLDEINSKNKHLRHKFYPSPTHAALENKMEQAKLLTLRLFEIINQFETSGTEIKVTPSQQSEILSNKSIPFYYEINNALLSSWDFAKTLQNEEDTNLSYHTELLAEEPHIQEPLAFTNQTFNFYRIEGHQELDF